ncbi:MAG: hypothetical protein O2923_09975 [Verrucomicrobia bacterium]|nr:hypothetical protein [Verrucomicrobiota bacterium]MDA1086986.1 hypothetical protein [Verrucomicrobiota bacterium]
MKANRNLAVLIATATVAAVVGLLMTTTSIADASEHIQRMQRKADHIRTLRDYEETSRSRKAQQAIVEGFRGRPGPSLPALAREIIPEANAEVRERKSTPAMNGWVLRQADVSLSEVPMLRVADLIEAAEAGRPPWRLTSCTMRASPQTEGHGQVTLSFELLEPK